MPPGSSPLLVFYAWLGFVITWVNCGGWLLYWVLRQRHKPLRRPPTRD